jgi:hypothetical protein
MHAADILTMPKLICRQFQFLWDVVKRANPSASEKKLLKLYRREIQKHLLARLAQGEGTISSKVH